MKLKTMADRDVCVVPNMCGVERLACSVEQAVPGDGSRWGLQKAWSHIRVNDNRTPYLDKSHHYVSKINEVK
jgi:hypothetical protein